MKKLIASILFASSNLLVLAQCSTVAVSVSSSDTTFIQLYHPGFFNIPSGNANICDWEVSAFSGGIIYQNTTSGSAFDQGLVFFNHSVPITDSMNVTIVITNNVEGITCTISDTLIWKETEVLPGSFIGDWDVLSRNGGVEEVLSSMYEANSDEMELLIYPSPSDNFFQIRGNQESYSFSISDSNGQIFQNFENVQNGQKINVSDLSKGIYFVQFWDKYGLSLSVRKMLKK